jgi:hypothetical protein
MIGFLASIVIKPNVYYPFTTEAKAVIAYHLAAAPHAVEDAAF